MGTQALLLPCFLGQATLNKVTQKICRGEETII